MADKNKEAMKQGVEAGLYERYKVELTPDELSTREELFATLIQDYYTRGIATRLSMIREWRDMVDQVLILSDYPWEDAPASKDAIIPLVMGGVGSKIHRLFWKASKIIKASTDYKDVSEHLTKFENWANYKLKKKIKLPSEMRHAEKNTFEDGTGLVEVYYAYETKMVKIDKDYSDLAIFRQEFPSARESGVDEDKYNGYVAKLEKGDTISIDEVHEKVLYKGAKARTIERENFIILPAESFDIESAKGVGKKFIMSEDDIIEGIENEVYDSPVIGQMDSNKYAFQKIQSVEGHSTAEKQQKLDKAGVDKVTDEGSETQNKEEAGYEKDYYTVELLWKDKLGNDKKQRDYIYTMCIDPDYGTVRIIQVLQYYYEHGERKYSRIVYESRKSDQFDGVSFPYKLRHIDKNLERILTLWGATWEMAIMPPIGAEEDIKEDYVDDWVYKPGQMWFMKNPKENLKALDIAGRGTPDTMNLIAHQEKMAELIIGYGANLSGRESPGDPNAPGNKTAMLMRAGLERIVDGAEEMLESGVNRIVRQCLSLEYQFRNEGRSADEKFEETFEVGRDKKGAPEFETITEEVMAVFEKVNMEIDFELATNAMNRQIDRDDFLGVMEILYKSDPDIQQDPYIRATLRNEVMELYELPVRHLLNLSQEEVEERQARVLAKAMKMNEEAQKQQDAELDSKTQQLVEKRRAELKAQGIEGEESKKRITEELSKVDDKMSQQ